jgi:ribokinase
VSVVVVGSANLDLVYTVERIPRPGETVLASSAASYPGGKGNNQVVAVARSGADVAFVAAMGKDDASESLLEVLRDAGVRALVRRTAEPTGTALITVDESAENVIVVNSGANAALTDLTDDELGAIRSADVLLMQLEVPLATVLRAAATARQAGTRVVLNAAPIQPLPAELLELVDLLIVNEHEAAEVAGGVEPADHAALAAAVLALVPSAVITLGADGALVLADGETRHVPGHRVDAVDTTGAGDTFCGALVAALDADGAALSAGSLGRAAEWATAAAALAVQRPGAVPAIPTVAEVEEYLASR